MAGIALLGAGIFAREQHLPAIEANSNLVLKAVYSRSQESAEKLASSAKTKDVTVYFDSPATPGKSLDDLLARDDISAVNIALPILHQPDVIKKSLTAGKHVLSEKPVAGDVQAAKDLIAWYAALGDKKPLWAVAENFRYMDSVLYAAEEVKKLGGNLLTFRMHKYGYVEADNKYFNTDWRKVPGYQGGFLLDGGVHFVAALRYILEATGQRIEKLAGFSALLEERLVPVDTVNAVALTQDGKSGTVVITFGTEFKDGLEVEIITTKGTVTWSPRAVITATGKQGESKKEFGYNSGVQAEVAAFEKAVAAGKADPLQSPEEALKDLSVLQGLLESGDAGAAVKTVA
ncbi:oxidoreductase-like protein [Podospora australis]|uniref:Oxidoreductase-like protein n=1 Tax=Podospora australis TaxID=1536484 RepID=A0AAN6WHV7_9PEZI|nr:oxidoreductase-like protein [Podospora australis]